MPILKLVVKTIKLGPIPAGLSINSVLNSSIKPSLRLRPQPKNNKPTLSNSTTKCTSLVPLSLSASWPPPPSLAPLASGDAATKTVSRAPMAQFTSATHLATGSCPLSAAVGPAARSTPTTPTRTVSARAVRDMLALNHGQTGRDPIRARTINMSPEGLELIKLYSCRKLA